MGERLDLPDQDPTVSLTTGNTYFIKDGQDPLYPPKQGLGGVICNFPRLFADDPDAFYYYMQNGFNDFVNGELEHQQTDVQTRLGQIMAIPDLATRSVSLLPYFQELSERHIFPTPSWVQKLEKPVYQIMVDRFNNPDLWSDDKIVRAEAWRTWLGLQHKKDRDLYDNLNFAGGTLKGIINQIGYIKSIAGALYLNPIFASDTVHGYNTSDYFSINRRLTGLSEKDHQSGQYDMFLDLAEEIPVVLDIAVNHTGRNFFALQDLRKNGAQSQYADWYRDLSFDAQGKLIGWKGWWGYEDLPELNHHSQGVRNHFLGKEYDPELTFEEQSPDWHSWVNLLKNPEMRKAIIHDPAQLQEAQEALGVIGFWSCMGIKGWRLDVPNDVNRQKFWQEFRTLVKFIDPEIWLVGEIWDNDEEAHWLNSDKFDAVMNYRFWQSTLDFLIGQTEKRDEHMAGARASSIDAKEFSRKITNFVSRHPQQVIRAMMNNIGTHDVPRLADLLEDKTGSGLVTLMTLPGVPSIWAGDEIGMNNPDSSSILDPVNRKPFRWQPDTTRAKIPENKNISLVRALSDLRASHTALRSSNIEFIDTGNPDVLAYRRLQERDDPKKNTVLVIINRSGNEASLKTSDLLTSGQQLEEYIINGKVVYDGETMVIAGNFNAVYASILQDKV